MDLERVSVVLRPRSSWEAMDLGLALLNANRRVVWTTFGICVMPIYAAVWLIFYRWPPIAFFLLWWLKPLFDRVPLAILSEALFGGDVSVKAAMRALRRSVRPFLLRSLTVSRLSPIRSFLLPIWQLEGHKGTSVLRRERVLGGATLGPAASLMAVCAGLEQCFMLSGLSFIFMFMPENLEMDVMGVFESMSDGLTPLWFSVAFGVVHALAVAFVEPVYVAAGFGLYVNRRMSLEGWDVELGFRRMVNRLGPTLLALFALSLAAPRAWAADDTGAPQEVSVEAQEAAIEAQRAAAAEAQRRAGPPVEREAVAAEGDALRLEAAPGRVQGLEPEPAFWAVYRRDRQGDGADRARRGAHAAGAGAAPLQAGQDREDRGRGDRRAAPTAGDAARSRRASRGCGRDGVALVDRGACRWPRATPSPSA